MGSVSVRLVLRGLHVPTGTYAMVLIVWLATARQANASVLPIGRAHHVKCKTLATA